MFDSKGQWGQRIKDKISEYSQLAIDFIDNIQQDVSGSSYTIGMSRGLGISILCCNANVQFSGVVDGRGNVSLQVTGNVGINNPSFGVSINQSITATNAPETDKLTGDGMQIGGSIVPVIKGIPVILGGDLNIIPDYNMNTAYHGLTLSTGVASPGWECHVSAGKTAELFTINIYEEAKKVFSFFAGD